MSEPMLARSNDFKYEQTSQPQSPVQGVNNGENTDDRALVRVDSRSHENAICVAPAQQNKTYFRYDYGRPQSSAHEAYNLTLGFLAHVYIDVPGGTPMLLQDTKVPIRALRFMSPVINVAVKRNGWDADLDHIALPAGNRQAYLDILRWLDNMLLSGRWTPLNINDKDQLFAISSALNIAEKLRIHLLLGDLHRQLDDMLHFMVQVREIIPTNEIYELYKSGKFGKDFPLRRKIPKVLAQARMSGIGKGIIRKLVRKFEDLGLEMDASQQTFEFHRWHDEGRTYYSKTDGLQLGHHW